MRQRHRVKRLEVVFAQPADVTWAEVEAAAARLRVHLFANVRALLEGTEPRRQDPEQTLRDARVLRLWRRQQRSWVHEASKGVRDSVYQKLARWDVDCERAREAADGGRP